MSEPHIIDVRDEAGLRSIPPCADPRFDHRTCDYWEDADRGSRQARSAWLVPGAAPAPVRPGTSDNPFVPPRRSHDAWNPFALDAPAEREAPGDEMPSTSPDWNPFRPAPRDERSRPSGVPRKLSLLDRGRGVFGSYAKLLLVDDLPVAYAQFGPLSAYPRAGRLRELYPRLPDAPLPAIITCIATTAEARGHGHARRLVEAICEDLAGRGFAAVEAYPDLTRPEDESSAARPAFWVRCGFRVAVDDERFPVLRRELE